MARTRTLAELVADVRYRADVEGMTDRHPDANVKRLINESYQTLRELVSAGGDDFYLTYETGTFPTSEASEVTSHAEITMPEGAVRIHGIDVLVNDEIIELEPVSHAERNDYRNTEWIWGNVSQHRGVPQAFRVLHVGAESGTTADDGTIAIYPVPDESYQYAIWYLPAWQDITTDSHVINGIAGWEDFIVWDCVIKIASRDNDSKNTYAIAVQERAAALARILGGVKTQKAGPLKRIDAREQRLRRRSAGLWR